MNVLDLFSGIGGFSLGLERVGMRTVAFCEVDPFCRAVLAKHWPGIPCFPDIRNLTSSLLEHNDIWPDVLCGGFPCQDISVAGKGAGLAGERSGLWGEYARLIGEIRPRYVVVENVSALLGRGLDTVLGDLASLGYDAEWHCIPASYVGAPHRRDRTWIIAYPGCDQLRVESRGIGREGRPGTSLPRVNGEAWTLADSQSSDGRRSVAEPGSRQESESRDRGESIDVADTAREHVDGSRIAGARRWAESTDGGWWASEPDVGRVAHGVPARVDRLRALGNAVVRQVVEIIGEAIMRHAFASAKESKS